MALGTYNAFTSVGIRKPTGSRLSGETSWAMGIASSACSTRCTRTQSPRCPEGSCLDCRVITRLLANSDGRFTEAEHCTKATNSFRDSVISEKGSVGCNGTLIWELAFTSPGGGTIGTTGTASIADSGGITGDVGFNSILVDVPSPDASFA